MEVGGETVKPLQSSWLPNARLLMASSPFLCTDSHPQGTPGGLLGSSIAHGCQGALLTPRSHSHLQSPSCAFLCRGPYLIALFFPHHLRLPCPQLMSLTIWALITTSRCLFLAQHSPLEPVLLAPGPPCCFTQTRVETPPHVQLQYCRVFKVEGTSETIRPDGALQGMSAATPESAFAAAGRRLLLLLLLLLPHPETSPRSICLHAGVEGEWGGVYPGAQGPP